MPSSTDKSLEKDLYSKAASNKPLTKSIDNFTVDKSMKDRILYEIKKPQTSPATGGSKVIIPKKFSTPPIIFNKADRRMTKTMTANNVSKSTGAKTRKTLKTSTALPKPKKMTMANPGTAKVNKPPVKRMNVKKGFPALMAASAASDPKGFGEGIKAAGEGIGAATGGKGIQSLTPMGQMKRKSIGAPGMGIANAPPAKTVPSMDKGLGSDYVRMPEPLNVMIRKAFTVLVPAIQKEMQKDLKKGAGGIIGTGLGGALGSLAGPLGAAAGAMGGGALGDSLSGGKSVAKKTKRINPAKNIDVKKAKTGGIVGAGLGGAIGSLAGPLGAAAGAMGGGALGEEVGKSSQKPAPKGGKYYTAPAKTKVTPKRGGKYVSKAGRPDKNFTEGGHSTSAPKDWSGSVKTGDMSNWNPNKSSAKNPKNVEKGWKQTAGMLGGAALGSAFGPIGAGAGAYAGKKLGDHLEKPKVAPKRATRKNIGSVARMSTAKNPKAKVYKAFPPADSNIPIKSVKINKVSYGKSKDSPVKKSFLTEENSVLTSTQKKTVRDNKDYHEEINDVLTKKQPDMERSELDMAKSQASLRVEKAIFYLKGYEPMDDNSVKKMFHGQIPEIMKSAETRPPQVWMDKSVSKSAAFVEDPIKYSMELWYDINKAVAEPIDSKLSPKKKGEDEQISDGTRCDVSDLAGKDKSEITETL